MWCKHSNFEQATRSPLIISAPKLPRPGPTSSPVESVDIFPTLCELAKLPTPEQLDGTSLVPILKDPYASVQDFAMSQYPRRGNLMGYALRTERYRLVAWLPLEVSRSGIFDASEIKAIELYDYQTDPLETANLSKNPEYKSVLRELEVQLARFFEQR
jgi:arylsulfatase A-like enzyme